MKREIYAGIMAALIAAGSAIGVTVRTTEKPCEAETEYTACIVYDDVEYTMSAAEWDAVFNTVMAEAGGESYEGQKAVAQCILNKCRLTGHRPLEVLESDGYASTQLQPTQSVKCACIDVFKYGEIDTACLILYEKLHRENAELKERVEKIERSLNQC